MRTCRARVVPAADGRRDWALETRTGRRGLDVAGLVLEGEALELLLPPQAGPGLYRHGYTSWSPTAWWRLDAEPWRVWDRPERLATAEDAATDRQDRHRSYLLTAVELQGPAARQAPEGQGGGAVAPAPPPDGGKDAVVLLLGRLGGDTGVLDVWVDRIEALTLEAAAPGAVPQAGAEGPGPCAQPAASGPVRWWLGVGPEQEVFAAWARALQESLAQAGRLHERLEDPGPVWSSWYSWFEEVTADRIEAETGPAARSGYVVLQVDDGWERAVGDWQPNEGFPQGMGPVADRIRAAGLLPGLWVAPFIVSSRSTVAAERPEMLVHDEEGWPVVAGYNWGAPYHAVDCTHPLAQEWLGELVERLVSWGFSYLKLDFLNAAAVPGRRWSAAGRETAYRQGLELLRRSAPGVYLMASGAVVAPSLGVVDGMRVGPDTAPYWDNVERHRDPSGPAVRNALRSAVARLWLKPLADVDPDVAFVRSRGSLLSPQACQATQDMALVAGVLGCSDPYAWLTEDERETVARLCAQARRHPSVRRTGRYSFEVDGRYVDLGPWINPAYRVSDRILAK